MSDAPVGTRQSGPTADALAGGRDGPAAPALSAAPAAPAAPALVAPRQDLPWSLIVEPEGRPGHEHMAIDDALLHAACDGVAFLRCYRWVPGCLSFGRNEPARTRYDRERITTLGLPTVRRPTGGRAVWHDREVTYAVAAPVGCFGSLVATYRAIHAMLAAALCRLGARAELATPRPAMRLGAGACFASPAGGEVVVDGRKLVGSAQVRERGAFLQHGSILLADDQAIVAGITKGVAPLSRATALGEVLGRTVTFAEVSEAIAATAREGWSGSWTRTPAPAMASWGRFADPAWTWRR